MWHLFDEKYSNFERITRNNPYSKSHFAMVIKLNQLPGELNRDLSVVRQFYEMITEASCFNESLN